MTEPLICRESPADSKAAPIFAWYHGSPRLLTILAAGSTITPRRELARVFSHKPELVALQDDGRLQHNGTLPGYLYTPSVELAADDIIPHPNSSMPGNEWLTQRDLPVTLIETTIIQPDESLSPKEEAELQRQIKAWKQSQDA